ncbi:MAG: helix-turn-helix domain-containing protein [Tepidisphaeraceae bacterium]|jgi:hypothetical protein
MPIDPPPIPPLLLTELEAANALRMSRRELFRLRKSGELRFFRHGRLVGYRPKDLQEFVDSHVNGEPAAGQREAVSA